MRLNATIADADKFEKNSYFENMARLKAEKPDVFDLLSNSEKIDASDLRRAESEA